MTTKPMRRRPARALLPCAAVCLAAAFPAAALPPTAIVVVEGAVVFTPHAEGGGVGEISILLENRAGAALESVRVRTVFATQRVGPVPPHAWCYRTEYFKAPLEPGEQGWIRWREEDALLHSRIEIVSVQPVLRIALNGVLADLQPPPFLWEGVTHGPLGDIARGLGLKVIWHEPWQLAVLISDHHTVVLQMGSSVAARDGEALRLPTAPRLVQAAAIGPVSSVLRALGANVDYDPDLNLVNIRLAASEPDEE